VDDSRGNECERAGGRKHEQRATPRQPGQAAARLGLAQCTNLLAHGIRRRRRHGPQLTHELYPNLVAEGTTVPTIANRALLVAYTWPENSPRYKRISKFVDAFFSKIDQFDNPSRHPKWREVNLSAEMPGWVRYKPAAEWLAAHRNQAVTASSDRSASSPELKAAFETFMQKYRSSSGQQTLSIKEREALFARFLKFLAESKVEQAAAAR